MSNRIDPRTPILVGGAQFTQRTAREGKVAREPLARSRCWRRSRATRSPIRRDDIVGRARHGRRRALHGGLAGRSGPPAQAHVPQSAASPGRTISAPSRAARFYTATGGNTPQWLVNRTAEEIAQRRMRGRAARGRGIHRLAAGCDEAGRRSRLGKGADHRSGQRSGRDRRQRPGTSDYERRYGLHFPVNVYPLFENALRGETRRTPAEHLEMARQVLLAVHEGRVGESLCLVSDLSLAGGDFDAVGEEPLRRLSLHEISERRDRGRHGGRRGDDERRQGARARHPGIQMGLPAWLRRRQRHLERQRARELSFLARDPHDRQEGVRDGGHRASAICRSSISIPAFRARSRSAARSSASRPTIRAVSPSPAGFPISAARETTMSCIPSSR